MDDPTTTLATRTGLDPGTVRKGLGAVLAFIKGHCGSDVFDRVQAAVPGAPEMLAAYESGQEGGGGAAGAGAGIFGTVTNLAGSLLGGRAGEGASLLAMLSRAGLDPGQIQAFLPGLLAHLQGILPADVLEKIRAVVPVRVPDETAEGAAP